MGREFVPSPWVPALLLVPCNPYSQLSLMVRRWSITLNFPISLIAKRKYNLIQDAISCVLLLYTTENKLTVYLHSECKAMSCLRHISRIGLRPSLVTARCKSDALATVKPTNVRRIVDELNPVPNYEYAFTESYPVPGVDYGPPPTAETGVHAITGETVRFPYFHKHEAHMDHSLTIKDMVEIVDKNSEKGPLDMWLDGFQFPDLPKSEDQVYRIRGTQVGERGPFWELFQLYRDEYPAVEKAQSFWRPYATMMTETLSEELFDAMWIHFFHNPLLDSYELRRGLNIIYDLDMVPEPAVLEAMFRACRRLNEYPMTIRILEGIKNKVPKDPAIYQWLLQEIQPVMEELGIVTPDELGLHIAPEGKGPLPY